ncbi:MAG: hypothetical protein H8D23_31970 [Candidatus Brocadiales bacterium]|nr:hypothetical protein [Candidatus Brocadiales bacterium]
MKAIKALVIGLSIFYCSIAFTQSRDISVKLKHGLPKILKVSNVKVYSDSPTSSKISIWVNVKKGKIVSVARGKGDWIITVRTRGQVSTYVVAENTFKVVGQESKAVKIRALHFTES